MTDLTATMPHLVQGKHNMASDAFQAVRAAHAAGTTPRGQELSFADIVDTLNPLQHIPVVAQIYRHLTGDTISPMARVAGGALYGGPIGLVTSLLDAAVAEQSGSDIGEHLIATLTGGEAPTQVADAAPAGTPAAPPADKAATPASPASFGSPETIASIATPAVAPGGPVPKPLPQLSPDAFNALIGSFADPAAAKAANPDLAKAAAAKNEPAAPATTPGNARIANDLIGAMQANLDQFEALKATNPGLTLPTAFAPAQSGGF